MLIIDLDNNRISGIAKVKDIKRLGLIEASICDEVNSSPKRR